MFEKIFKCLMSKSKKSEKFVCMNCGQQKSITQKVCLDPQLCATCVDEDNNREYELAFGKKRNNY